MVGVAVGELVTGATVGVLGAWVGSGRGGSVINCGSAGVGRGTITIMGDGCPTKSPDVRNGGQIGAASGVGTPNAGGGPNAGGNCVCTGGVGAWGDTTGTSLGNKLT